MSSSQLKASKLVGTGNDFVFVDSRQKLPGLFGKTNRAEIARKLCDRHFGIGGDGMVFVEPGSKAGILAWDFYNTDGSFAEMCGNATRCMGRWSKNHLGLDKVKFQTQPGIVEVSVQGETVSSHLEFVKPTFKPVLAEVAGKQIHATLVNTGVPHAVIKIDDLEAAALQRELIGAMRFHAAAGERGANVTFFQITGRGQLRTKTFERGVEGFTLSCGTGVIASAAVCLSEQGGLLAEVWTPGGELTVEFGSDFNGVTLSGPAIEIFETEIGEEILK